MEDPLPLSLFLDAELSTTLLPKRFVNALNKSNCYTNGQVIALGRKQVAKLKGVGVAGITEFEYLLINQGCLDKFI